MLSVTSLLWFIVIDEVTKFYYSAKWCSATFAFVANGAVMLYVSMCMQGCTLYARMQEQVFVSIYPYM